MGEVEPTPDAACFAWSAAEILDRDECTPGPPRDLDWAGKCLGEDGFPARDYHPRAASDDPARESPVAKFARIVREAERSMNLLNTWDDEDKP